MRGDFSAHFAVELGAEERHAKAQLQRNPLVFGWRSWKSAEGQNTGITHTHTSSFSDFRLYSRHKNYSYRPSLLFPPRYCLPSPARRTPCCRWCPCLRLDECLLKKDKWPLPVRVDRPQKDRPWVLLPRHSALSLALRRCLVWELSMVM